MRYVYTVQCKLYSINIVQSLPLPPLMYCLHNVYNIWNVGPILYEDDISSSIYVLFIYGRWGLCQACKNLMDLTDLTPLCPPTTQIAKRNTTHSFPAIIYQYVQAPTEDKIIRIEFTFIKSIVFKTTNQR